MIMMFFLHVSFFPSLYVSFAFFTRLSLSLSFIFICHMFIFIDQDDHIYSWTHFTHIRLYLYIITYYNKGTWHGKKRLFFAPSLSYSTSFPLKNNSAMINLIPGTVAHFWPYQHTRFFQLLHTRHRHTTQAGTLALMLQQHCGTIIHFTERGSTEYI